MRTGRAVGFATAHLLAAESNLGSGGGAENTVPFELGLGKDQETAKIVRIEVANRVEEIAVQRHVLSHFEGGEQSSDVAVIGQLPTSRRAKPGGVINAQGIRRNLTRCQFLDPHMLF